MINELTCKITNYIENNSDIKHPDRLAEINYALQTIFNETLKTIFLLLVFQALGNINYFLFSLLILISIRTFAGGYHCNTTLKCLFFSLLFFLTTSWLGPRLPQFSNTIYYALAFVSIIIVIFYAPFPNKKRPIKSKKRRFVLKIISIFFTIAWIGILLFLNKDLHYLNCGFLSIILETAQIIPIKKGELS